MNKLSWLLLVLFVFAALTSLVYASDEDVVNLLDFPQKLCDALGMPTKLFAGQLLASSIVLALFLLPTVFACSKFNKAVAIPSVFVGFLSLSFCIALCWLPYWLLIMVAILIGLMFASNFKNLIGGGG